MGNYNPHAPYIIGQEWVPIRQANYVPDKVTEQGYTFHIDHSATPVTGAYYVEAPPQSKINLVSDLISVYPAGQEALTGPIKQVIIPASAIWVTGTAISAGDGVAALLNPSDDLSIILTGPSDFNTRLGVSFDVTSYSQQLFGKRILDVSFRYSIATHTPEILQDVSIDIGFARDMSSQFLATVQNALEGSVTGETSNVASFSIGSLNLLYDATRDIYSTYDVYPWRYQEIARFAATEPAASRLIFSYFNSITASFNAFIYYTAMVVTYCEETRVLYGGRRVQAQSGSGPNNTYDAGPNLVRMLNPSLATGTALTPGDYVVTLTHDDYPTDGQVGSATVKALRELYPVSQIGTRVSKSLVIDDTFTSETIPVLTELTLHTATAVVTGVHPYGTQDDIPVYGTITAIQEIEDDPVGTAKSFPQVRFYARRFGATTAPLALVDVATGLSTVSISVVDFDALTEIVDGWREVNLRFDVPPSFTTAAGDVDWRWQATSELARNQWQVLGMGSQTFAAHSIGLASYYAPQGNTVDLTWQSPVISGTAEDTLSDAVLIFSTDTPTVSGFAVTGLSQPVSVAEGCIVPPRCLPTGIDYQHLSWTVPDGIACDPFDTAVVAGWGTAPTGQTWTIGATPSQWNIANGIATIQPSANNADRFSVVTTNTTDNFVRLTFSVSALPASGALLTGATIRYVDSSNNYIAQASIATTGIITISLAKRLLGTPTTVATFTTTLVAGVDQRFIMKAQAVGTALAMKIWPEWQDEPNGWMVTGVDTSITTGTMVGAYARNTSAVVTQIFSYDDFSAVPFQLLDGRYEIQRMDTLDSDWQTIVDTTDLCITSFDDYESRVGIATQYRLRLCNALDFCTPTWATASGTLTAPGVTVNGTGNSVLIFTSNENPDANLAYVMQWEGQPIETFAFPEASEVQLQRMYGKDFFTAFHPLERGGDQFTRTILVNAAAIALPSLANFSGLRDLAWDDLNYVCVRDELGNRWFANIIVPDGNARLDRTIYMAQIQVSETTGTPTPIDLAVT